MKKAEDENKDGMKKKKERRKRKEENEERKKKNRQLARHVISFITKGNSKTTDSLKLCTYHPETRQGDIRAKRVRRSQVNV